MGLTEFAGTSEPRLRILGSADLLAGNGASIDDVLRRPKRLALLSYLAVATPHGFHRRDTILALFWPELDQDRARGALRQALYGLGKALGENVVSKRGAGEIGVDTAALWCDAVEFERLLSEGKRADALALYRGDALVGLFVPGAGPDLEQWMADTRERLRNAAVDSALHLAEAAVSSHASAEAARWANWATVHSPDDENVVRAAMSILATAGDRAGALRTHDNFAVRLRAEFEADPSSDTAALATRIRNEKIDTTKPLPLPSPRIEKRPISVQTTATVAAGHESHGTTVAEAAPLTRRRLNPRVIGAASILVLAGAAVFASRAQNAGISTLENHTILIGPVAPAPGQGVDEIAQIIPPMLGEELDRVRGVQVIDRMRVLELHAERHNSVDGVAAARVAARDAGADVLVRGSLEAGGEHQLRLRLWVENLGKGTTGEELEVTGQTASELVQQVIGRIARQGSPAAIAAAMPDRAWRVYDDGLRALARGDSRAASELLAESFSLDSTHALTAFYLYSALERLSQAPSTELLRRAVLLSSQAAPVDRLRIQVRWAEITNDPLSAQLTDSLVQLAPHDPQALLAAGSALIRSGEFLRAAPLLRRIVPLDSSSRGSSVTLCLACRALELLATTYALAGSTEAAAGVQRELTLWKPNDADNWRSLAFSMGHLGRFAEQREARQRALEIRPGDSAVVVMDDALLALTEEDYSTADKTFTRFLQSPRSTADQKTDALWWWSISLRQQGRMQETLATLRRMKAAEPRGSPNVPRMLHEAETNAESGEWKAALTLFDSASRVPALGADLASSYGRQRAWTLTHVSRARVALGDTAGLMELADTVRNLGALSTFGRDWRLHHFIRAEVFEQRGDTARAIDEFRRSIYSPSLGFTRANFELSRLLIARRRPHEAIDLLQAALRGGRDASNLYITAPELHELLAKAYEMTGARDSAAAHFAAVASTWRGGDPKWRSRAQAAAARAAALGGDANLDSKVR